jgi:hypothetical protein
MTVVRTTSHQEQPSSCPERGGSCPAHAHATPSSRTGRSTGRDGVPHHLHGTARTPGGAHRASGASTAWSAGAKRARAWRSSAVRLRCFAVGRYLQGLGRAEEQGWWGRGGGWGCSGPVPAARGRGGYAGAVTMAIACASAAAPGIQALNSGPEFRPGIQAWAGES